MHAYAGTDHFGAQTCHMMKTDRQVFNRPGVGDDGFQLGHSLYFIRHQEIRRARYSAISSMNTWGQEHIIKFRFPGLPYSAMHVINGPAMTPLSGMIMIKHYDCFRPMPQAEVWWFEILERPINWGEI